MPLLGTRGAGSAKGFGFGASAAGPSSGQQAYTSPGTYTWVAPSGVTSVSAAVVGSGGNGAGGTAQTFICPCDGLLHYFSQGGGGGGGGALAYVNNISVTPGASYTVTVQPANSSKTTTTNTSFSTFVVAGSGLTANYCNAASRGEVVTGTGYAGGVSGSSNGRDSTTSYPAMSGAGGGGAGGYAAAGGTGGCFATSGQTKTGGGGGGGGGGNTGGRGGGGGGGAQVFGTLSPWCATTGTGGGATGVGGSSVYSNGGSGGTGTTGGVGGDGGNLGGGGGGGGVLAGGATGSGGAGGFGGVRIIWPGTTRQYPSTGTNSV